jgi:hypothetical protein
MSLATTPILPVNIERRTIANYHWRPVRYAAQYYNRSERTIQQWCESGQFSKWNIRTYKNGNTRGPYSRWWIFLPEDEHLI